MSLGQGCNLSPALFNIYINELATILEKPSAPGVSLHKSEVNCLLFTDYLCLLSPTAHGLQQSLDLLAQYCQTWALAVNPKTTKIMIFQRRSRSQGIRPKFSICTKYIYKISKNKSLTVAACYRPPSAPSCALDTICELIAPHLSRTARRPKLEHA